MSFDKAFKTAKSSIKTTIDIAISNGMNFSVQSVPLSDQETGNFAPSEDVFCFIEAYVKDTMKFQRPNEKALNGMKAKWAKTHGPNVPFVLKKQPSELLVVLIAPSDECIHLFYSVPKSLKYTVPEAHSEDQWEYSGGEGGEGRTVYYARVNAPKNTSLFKYRDQLLQEILNDLKKQGIYVDDDSDDDVAAYYT